MRGRLDRECYPILLSMAPDPDARPESMTSSIMLWLTEKKQLYPLHYQTVAAAPLSFASATGYIQVVPSL